jgi:hypothetical protein
MEDLRYPIGKAPSGGALELDLWIAEIAETPARLREAVRGLTGEQLDTPYRPGGWTVRQVVHHVPDSHLNAYMRYRLALTEDEPMIKSYDEARWAELVDARTAPVAPSLALLEALHERWVALLRGLTPEQWRRRFRHPEREVLSLAHDAGVYAWHGRHHVAHITNLKNRMGWK